MGIPICQAIRVHIGCLDVHSTNALILRHHASCQIANAGYQVDIIFWSADPFTLLSVHVGSTIIFERQAGTVSRFKSLKENETSSGSEVEMTQAGVLSRWWIAAVVTQSENQGESHVERLPLLPGIRSHPSHRPWVAVVLVDVLVRRRSVLIARWAPQSTAGSLRRQEFLTGPQKGPLVLQRTEDSHDRAETFFEVGILSTFHYPHHSALRWEMCLSLPMLSTNKVCRTGLPGRAESRQATRRSGLRTYPSPEILNT